MRTLLLFVFGYFMLGCQKNYKNAEVYLQQEYSEYEDDYTSGGAFSFDGDNISDNNNTIYCN